MFGSRTLRVALTGVVAIALGMAFGSRATVAQSGGSINIYSGAGVTLPFFGAIAADPNVDVSMDGGLTWADAYATDDPWGFHPFEPALWIGPNPQLFGNPEEQLFRVSFDLPADFMNASLTLDAWADDQLAGVKLNDTTVLSNDTGWETFPAFSGPQSVSYSGAGFQCGENVLYVHATNLGGVGGLTFNATVTYDGGAVPCAPSAAEQAAALAASVVGIGSGNSLSAQAAAVVAAIALGDTQAALDALTALENHVNAGANSKGKGSSLTSAQRASILAAIASLRVALGQ
jgi:hypothetical protein